MVVCRTTCSLCSFNSNSLLSLFRDGTFPYPSTGISKPGACLLVPTQLCSSPLFHACAVTCRPSQAMPEPPRVLSGQRGRPAPFWLWISQSTLPLSAGEIPPDIAPQPTRCGGERKLLVSPALPGKPTQSVENRPACQVTTRATV